jgi:hypothetical protein
VPSLDLNAINSAGAARTTQAGAGGVAAMRPSDANTAVVKPYVKQLQPMLKG